MKANIITNKSFFGYGIALLLYINTIIELKLFTLGLRVSEICIIGILLFVIILIFNEINKLLRENFTVKNIKYSTKANFYNAKIILENNIGVIKPVKKVNNLIIINKKLYKIILALL